MSRDDILKRVIKIVGDTMEVDASQVQEGTKLVDLGADSCDECEILMELEEAFDVNLPIDADEERQSIESLVSLVEQWRSDV